MSTQKNVTIAAMPLPFGGFVLAQMALVAILGVDGMPELLREGGIGSIITIMAAFGASIGAGLSLGLGAPRAIAIVVASSPWIVGGLFALMSMGKVVEVMGMVSAADRPIMLAAGTSEVSSLLVLGGALAAGTLFATALAFVLRAGSSDKRPRELAGAAVAVLVGGVALANALEASWLRDVLAAFSRVSAMDRMAIVAAEALQGSMAIVGYALALIGGAMAVAVVAVRARDAAPAPLVLALPALIGAAPLWWAQQSANNNAPTIDDQLAKRFPDVKPLVVDGGEFGGSLAHNALLRGGARSAGATPAAGVEEKWVSGVEYIVDAGATSDDLVALVNGLPDDVDRITLQALDGKKPPQFGHPLLDKLIALDALREVSLTICRAQRMTRPVVFALGKGPQWEIEERDGIRIVRVVPGAAPTAEVRAIFDANPGDPRCVAASLGTPADVWKTAAVFAGRDSEFGRGGIIGTLPEAKAVAGILGTFGKDAGGSLAALFGRGEGGIEAYGSMGIGDRPSDGGDVDTLGKASNKAESGTPVVLGSLDKEIIRRVVKQHLAQVQYCYEKELAKNPSLGGKVTMKWVINGEGKVTQTQVADTSMDNKDVEACIAKVIKKWMFPKPKGGGIVIVTFPFIFRVAG